MIYFQIFLSFCFYISLIGGLILKNVQKMHENGQLYSLLSVHILFLNAAIFERRKKSRLEV